MPSFQPSRLIGLRTGVAAFAVLAVLACWPAVGAALVIKSAGPLSSISIDEGLGCQVQASGDSGASFFPGNEPGACGTFLALTQGDFVNEGESQFHLFGPSPPVGVAPEAPFTPLDSGEPPTSDQSLTGNGSKANPFILTTTVRAIELRDGEHPIAELVEEVRYIIGQESYETKLALTSESGERLVGTLYHAGDCFLSDLDTGFGAASVPSPGSIACTIQPNNRPSGRFMAFTPGEVSGEGITAPRFFEGGFANVWSDVNREATPFPNIVEGESGEPNDNGMGLSWPISLEEEGQTVDLTYKTTISPASAPTSSSTAGACVANGQVPVTVSAVNGAKAVDYVLDGVPGSVPASRSGQATIPLAPGQHTLEYWGEDLTGAQEAAHHVLSVSVAAGGPSLTITSDQGHSSYEVGEAGSVTIAASGPGLTSNPSAAHVPISTTTPGTYSVSSSAADACGTTTASFSYTVIPPPVLGESVNVDVVSGKVFVALPATGHSAVAGGPFQAGLAGSWQMAASLNKGLKFVPLTQARQIPVGSILQTTAGVARITTATATKGKLQAGDFGAGIFKLLQARKQKGLTELDLIDAHSARQVCTTLGKKKAVVAKLSSKVLGRLTGSAHGHFTTRGQYSAATVRGTVWGVLNQCDGTLTRVTRGVVTVRDFRQRKTITLFTGQHYLARP